MAHDESKTEQYIDEYYRHMEDLAEDQEDPKEEDLIDEDPAIMYDEIEDSYLDAHWEDKYDLDF